MRRREVKWLEMLTQWDAYMLRNYRKVVEDDYVHTHKDMINDNDDTCTRYVSAAVKESHRV